MSSGNWDIRAVAIAMAVAAGFLASVNVCQASACDATASSTVLTHQGKSGLWFSAETSKCLLGEVMESRGIKRQLSLLEQKDALREVQLKKTGRVIEIMSQEHEALVDLAKSQSEALDSAYAWYRSPLFWSIFGAAVATGVYTALR